MFDRIKRQLDRRKNINRMKDMIGTRLASGCSRAVYVCKGDPNRIVKVAKKSDWDYNDEWANIIEWTIWNAVSNTKYAKYFAQCYELSPDGKYLVQERLSGVGSVKIDKKTKLPEFIGDIHSHNVGLRGNDVVIVDYASLKIKGENKYF